jgi:DNA-directed RNA polymerase specialized sigma24 family protein
MVIVIFEKSYIRGTKMDIEVYFKKIYTVAFRLTGNEKAASELASKAILKYVKELDSNGDVTSYIFKTTVLKVFKIFLEVSDTYSIYENTAIHNKKSKDKIQSLQEALLNLKPLNRVVVIWKDVLNFHLYDLMSSINCNKKELNDELSRGYRQIKEYLIKNYSK